MSREPVCSTPTTVRTRGPDQVATKKTATKTRPRAPKGPEPRVTVPPQVDDELALIWHGFKGDEDPIAREKLKRIYPS